MCRGGQASLLRDEDQGSRRRSKQVVHHRETAPSMALAKPERDQSKDHEEGAMLTGRLVVQVMQSWVMKLRHEALAALVACRWGSCRGSWGWDASPRVAAWMAVRGRAAQELRQAWAQGREPGHWCGRLEADEPLCAFASWPRVAA